jgi:sigma54-dependent transcription regulator
LQGRFTPSANDPGIVAVNVAGLDDMMFSDTLFGHKGGVYRSGQAREGLISKAENGTFFSTRSATLGELTDKTPAHPGAEYYRLGTDILLSNTRVIATTGT